MMDWDTRNYWLWILRAYNKEAKEQGWKEVPESSGEHMKWNCTVKAFMDGTYGKMRSSNSERQFVMEYAPFFQTMSEHLPS